VNSRVFLFSEILPIPKTIPTGAELPFVTLVLGCAGFMKAHIISQQHTRSIFDTY
jgi:hypothetical protein